MSDQCECIYCGKDFRVDEHPGEDRYAEHECPHCERSMNVSMSLTVNYRASCLDDKHDWHPYNSQCEMCHKCEQMRIIQ